MGRSPSLMNRSRGHDDLTVLADLPDKWCALHKARQGSLGLVGICRGTAVAQRRSRGENRPVIPGSLGKRDAVAMRQGLPLGALWRRTLSRTVGPRLPTDTGSATIRTMPNTILDPMPCTMITMDGSGRLVIPKETRKLLHLSSGSVLRLALVGNRLELTPMEPPGPKLRTKSGLIVVPRTGKTFDAVAAIAATRESRP